MNEKKTSEAQRKAVKKYKQKVNRITVDFSPAEENLWNHIQNQPKKQTYIKDLIRADMERSAARKAQFPNIPLHEFEIEIKDNPGK